LTGYIIRRLIQTIIVLLVVTFISFLLLHLTPGDPAAAMLGTEASREQIETLQKELWLDRPFIVQYGHWLFNVFKGDFGTSVMFRDPAVKIFAERLPITLYLSMLAFILSTFLGISAGIICAIRRGSILDQIVSLFANLGISTASFFLGYIGILVFSFKLGWLPISGYTSPLDDFWLSFKQIIMPVIIMATPGIAVMARQTRSSMLEVIHQDYIRTAYSKGLMEKVIVMRHALKNALIPVVTLLGMQIRILVGGSVIVETVFNIPGLGRLLVQGAINKDFIVIQGGVLLIGTIVCLANLLVDISYGWLNPRYKYE
jgi:peptide/nickel transport system permease protein